MVTKIDAWYNVFTLVSRKYTCGYCGENVSSEKGYYTNVSGRPISGYIYICHACNKPSFFDVITKTQTPGALIGGVIEHLPETIRDLYIEIQNTTTTGSYTATILSGRKLLMHIAVELGAQQGKNFVDYVDYLSSNGYTPPKGRVWVDEIRKMGNEANHEIVIMDEQHARSMVKFLEMLLKFNYEFPAEASEEDA